MSTKLRFAQTESEPLVTKASYEGEDHAIFEIAMEVGKFQQKTTYVRKLDLSTWNPLSLLLG